MVVRLIEQELPIGASRLPETARARCLAALLAELLGWWVERGATHAEEVEDMFNGLAVAILKRH